MSEGAFAAFYPPHSRRVSSSDLEKVHQGVGIVRSAHVSANFQG